MKRLSLPFIAMAALILTLAIAQPGLALPLFDSPIPTPTAGQSVWCANISAAFTPTPGQVSFAATLTNTTYITTPDAYPLNIPANRVYVGVWQEQNRRKTNTGYLFLVPPTEYGVSSEVAGSFASSSGGSPVRYFLRLWDSVDGAWGRDVCEPPPAVINPTGPLPPPPTRTAPLAGTWQTNYNPIIFNWNAPALAPGVAPVIDYELSITWGNNTTQTIATAATQAIVALPAPADQVITWRVRARNSAGYGRWAEPDWMYGIDATPPIMSSITETHGVAPGVWQNQVGIPGFTWSAVDPAGGSGLDGYLRTWTAGTACTPATFTTVNSFATPVTPGVYSLCVLARDRVGQQSGAQVFEFRYDPPAVTLNLTPAAVVVYPGQTVTFNAAVTNTSRSADSFTATLSTGGWTAAGWPSIISLTGLGVSTSPISLDVPAGAASGLIKLITVAVTSRSDPAVVALRTYTAQVSRADRLTANAPSSQFHRPAEMLTYTLTLTNGAAIPVAFDLTAASAWPVALPAAVTVPALSGYTFEANMTAPAGAAAGDGNTATITAAVHDYPTIAVQAAITGTVYRVDGLAVVGAASQLRRPAEPTTYTLVITNGSAVPVTFDLTAASGWPVSLPVSVTVPALSGYTFEALMPPPASSSTGDMNQAIITATIHDFPQFAYQAAITGTVYRTDGLAVVGAASQLRRPAEPTTYTLVLGNGSAIPVTFDLTAASGWPVSLPVSVTVPALSGYIFEALMPPPVSSSAGDMNQAIITATIHDFPQFAYQTAITGTVYRADELAVTPLSRFLPPILPYTFTLTNSAWVTDTYDLSVSSDWPVSLPPDITVGGSGHHSFTATMSVPVGVMSGTVNTAIVTAASRANPSLQLTQAISGVAGQVNYSLRVSVAPAGRTLVTSPAAMTTSTQLWIENNSNYTDQLAVTYSLPPAFSGGIAPPLSFPLNSLTGRLSDLSLSIPGDVATGEYVIPITVTGLYQQQTAFFRLAIINRQIGGIYLPLILKGESGPLPDLVGSFTVSSGPSVQVVATVTNIGHAPAGEFWIDFYVDPASPPTGPNQPWDYLCQNPATCQGIAWYVETPIPPGGSVTLTSAQGYPDNTRWTGNLGAGRHQFYLFVDSWNPTVATGAVLESDEGNNRSDQTLILNGIVGAAAVDTVTPVAGRKIRP